MLDAFRYRAMAATRVVRGEEAALKRRIAALYERCAKDMEREILRYGEDSLTGRRAGALRKSMRGYVHRLWQDVGDAAESAVRQGAALGASSQISVLDDALAGIGITTRPSFASVFAKTQDEAVATVLNGSMYAGKRAGLSRRIWNNEALQAGNIEQIIAAAVAQGRSAPQLAKDLEAYVNPKAMMPDHWNDIYPCPFLYKVDYNAKRLAVTALNHAYYQGAILAARENPFAEFLHWELSSAHLIYDVCDLYMEHDEGLGLGNFSLDNAPLPHPFCRCTWYIDSSKSLDEIGQELGRWLAGEENPMLDEAFGEWRQLSVANPTERGTISIANILIRPGVGARHISSFSFDAPDGSGEIHSIPGEYIRDVKVFAGKGTNIPFRDAWKLEEEYRVPASEWQKVKGHSWVEYQGEEYYAEIHWCQSEAIGRVWYKLKIQSDGRWWLDER